MLTLPALISLRYAHFVTLRSFRRSAKGPRFLGADPFASTIALLVCSGRIPARTEDPAPIVIGLQRAETLIEPGLPWYHRPWTRTDSRSYFEKGQLDLTAPPSLPPRDHIIDHAPQTPKSVRPPIMAASGLKNLDAELIVLYICPGIVGIY